ncbi:MAG: thiamine-phosphate kinase [Candidatus Aminicenantes bacterium]|nr:thiamine-phosphate kinase [Candidatus Aminicenantes bacterium]
MSPATVGRTGERELVRMIRRSFPATRRDVLMGIGDDAAVLRPGTKPWVLTKDLLVEDVDFRRRLHPPYFIGRKSLAVNISDAAAMGARPAFALLGLGLPADLELAWVREFLRGFRSMAREHGVDLVGGDLSAAREIVVSVTIIGAADRVVGRGGARPGDWLFVSGTLGDAALGFALLERGGGGGRARAAASLRRAFLDPVPRVELGLDLVRLKLPSAMIDVSDGLSVDLAHLCEASGTGAEVELGRIPLSAGMVRLGGPKTLDYALNGGEDFELLFAVRPTRCNRVSLTRLGRRHAITLIGKIMAGKGVAAVSSDGSRRPLSVRGYEHFR